MCFIKSFIVRISEIHVHEMEINPYKENLLDRTILLKSAGHVEKPISIRKAAAINSISEVQEYTLYH